MNKELANSTLTTGEEGRLRNCRGGLTSIQQSIGSDKGTSQKQWYVEDIVRHDSAVTHQLVRTGDITRTRDEDYPDVDNGHYTTIILTRNSGIVTRSDNKDTIMGRQGIINSIILH